MDSPFKIYYMKRQNNCKFIQNLGQHMACLCCQVYQRCWITTELHQLHDVQQLWSPKGSSQVAPSLSKYCQRQWGWTYSDATLQSKKIQIHNLFFNLPEWFWTIPCLLKNNHYVVCPIVYLPSKFSFFVDEDMILRLS